MSGARYSDSLYRTRSFDWAILVLPENCDPAPFMYWRAMLRVHDDDLMLLKISAGGRAGFLEDPFAGRQ
jgi:hypothetical protein